MPNGFVHVVVGTLVERLDLVIGFLTSRQHDDRHAFEL